MAAAADGLAGTAVRWRLSLAACAFLPRRAQGIRRAPPAGRSRGTWRRAPTWKNAEKMRISIKFPRILHKAHRSFAVYARSGYSLDSFGSSLAASVPLPLRLTYTTPASASRHGRRRRRLLLLRLASLRGRGDRLQRVPLAAKASHASSMAIRSRLPAPRACAAPPAPRSTPTTLGKAKVSRSRRSAGNSATRRRAPRS